MHVKAGSWLAGNDDVTCPEPLDQSVLSTMWWVQLIYFIFPVDGSVPFHWLALPTASLVTVAISCGHVEPKYINSIIRGAVGENMVLSNKQWPCGITCHGSYMSGSHYHPRSPAVGKPSSLSCVHLPWRLLRRTRLLMKDVITVICNHSPYNFSSVQQCTEGGSMNANRVLWFIFLLCMYLCIGAVNTLI